MSLALDQGALLRLLHICNPALPIGGFAYSQGLEAAIAQGWVHDEDTATAWILGLLNHSLRCLDVPVLARLLTAWSCGHAREVDAWSDFLYASRASRELQDEDRRLGSALAHVLVTWNLSAAEHWIQSPRTTYLGVFSLACTEAKVSFTAAATAYLFAWCENQTTAAVKLVPLGQSAGQRLLARAFAVIPGVVADAAACEDQDIGAAAPSHALASAWHETQYCRLFRS